MTWFEALEAASSFSKSISRIGSLKKKKKSLRSQTKKHSVISVPQCFHSSEETKQRHSADVLPCFSILKDLLFCRTLFWKRQNF